jgi:ABC-type antimicrobial peptide transport system permease subunit
VLSFFGTSVLVKTTGPPASLAKRVREEILALDPNLAVFGVQTMQEHVDKAMLIPRICAMLLGVFGAVGITLATVVLYGVMSYAARSRTREIGIRMALGAGAGSVLRMVAAQGVALVGVGLMIGITIAYLLSRFTASMLYGTSPADAPTYLVVSTILVVIALAAVFEPARRASRIDPVRALHYE